MEMKVMPRLICNFRLKNNAEQAVLMMLMAYFANMLPTLAAKILTAMANRITPKNLRTAINPFLPNNFSIRFKDFKAAYTIMRFNKMAMRIIYSFRSLRSNVALMLMMVVSVPEPAINGNAMGTMVPLLASLSALKNSMPSTISKPNKKMTMEPATAKERMSTPIKFKKGLPMKKNSTIKNPLTKVAFHSLMPPIFSLRLMSMGMLPTMSMTANKVKVTVSNSLIDSESIFKKS